MKRLPAYKTSALAVMLAVSAIMLLAPGPVLATGPGGARAETEHCLSCHGNKGIDKSFLDGQSVPAYVRQADYMSSIHGILACSTCHEGFSVEAHPQKTYRTRQLYSAKMSRSCRKCHSDRSILKVPVHESLIRKEREGKELLCQDCHGAHDIRRTRSDRAFVPEEQYCLGCHGQDISTTFANGDSFMLHMNAEEVRESAHRELNCSDCHFGFSQEEHPQRSFKNGRYFSLALSELCKRCHFDKYARTSESIHYKLLSSGRKDVPNCTDCHGSHSIGKASGNKLETARKCAACHRRVYGIYINSSHGSALIGEGNPDVPVCIDCHSAHDIVDPTSTEFHERIPSMCSRCHADRSIMQKYGLSTEVVKSYLTDFHGVTLSLYRSEDGRELAPGRPIAECTDCHGTHDITGDFGPNAEAVKRNLVRRCRTCHEDAGDDFPDAWLSHYTPSLAHAPLVFIVDATYRVLMPLMVLGLMLQILLHIWRYFSSR